VTNPYFLIGFDDPSGVMMESIIDFGECLRDSPKFR
jgi:hypothetical protein